MSGSEPGAVALVSMMGREARPAYFDGEFWRSTDSVGPVRCVPTAVTDAHPLVVIDLAALQRPRLGGERAFGAAELARTLRLIANADGDTYRADIVRELADLIAKPAPPKPEEPKGLAGLVRYDGSEWIGLHRNRWLEVPADEAIEPRRWHWDDFPSNVEVVREGWSE